MLQTLIGNPPLHWCPAGNKVVLNKTGPDFKVEDAEFEPNEVYAIDIVVSSGANSSNSLRYSVHLL